MYTEEDYNKYKQEGCWLKVKEHQSHSENDTCHFKLTDGWNGTTFQVQEKIQHGNGS